MNHDILSALRKVVDPELGINIVDLGLVCRADWKTSGIVVAITMTSPTCPFGHALVEQAESALREHFAEARAIEVDLVWTPVWSPARMSDAGRRQLGWLRPVQDRAHKQDFSRKSATPPYSAQKRRREH